MNQKKKILVISNIQFGYTISLYKHCEFLSEHYELTFVSWDYNLPKICLKGVKNIYLSRESNKAIRTLRLIKAIRSELNNGFYALYGTHFLGCSLVSFAKPGIKKLLYINTLAVDGSTFSRFLNDFILRIECHFFDKVATISNGVAKKVFLKKYCIIPLGGVRFKTNFEVKEQIALLYVGTLGGRNIIQCVKGFHKFISSHKRGLASSFTIVGDSDTGERDEIEQYIRQNRLEEHIKCLGFVPPAELESIYNRSNIGVSYVPITPYYENQPPTKTYEYLVSGLPVIATSTISNKEIVKAEDGVLIKDNEEAFYNGILKMIERFNDYDPEDIMRRNEKYLWASVLENSLLPWIEKK